MQKKRLTEEQIRIELEIKARRAHLEFTSEKLKVQIDELQHMKDLLKSYLAKKSGSKPEIQISQA